MKSPVRQRSLSVRIAVSSLRGRRRGMGILLKGSVKGEGVRWVRWDEWSHHIESLASSYYDSVI